VGVEKDVRGNTVLVVMDALEIAVKDAEIELMTSKIAVIIIAIAIVFIEGSKKINKNFL
jgi:hypothetical protein